MGDRRPGPECASELGADWIDGGTMCRSQSKAPGALGAGESAPAPKPARLEGEKAMIAYDIDIIADSPFGRTSDGKQVVRLLRQLDAHDNIAYGETHGDPPPRGEWDGKSITVHKDFYANACKTIVELVHEASHAIWRGRHPIGKGKKESTEEGAENEYQSVKNQLAIYKWLRDVRHFPSDAELERRLQQEEAGTLRSAIGENERASREGR